MLKHSKARHTGGSYSIVLQTTTDHMQFAWKLKDNGNPGSFVFAGNPVDLSLVNHSQVFAH